jgi:hypothetical protein
MIEYIQTYIKSHFHIIHSGPLHTATDNFYCLKILPSACHSQFLPFPLHNSVIILLFKHLVQTFKWPKHPPIPPTYCPHTHPLTATSNTLHSTLNHGLESSTLSYLHPLIYKHLPSQLQDHSDLPPPCYYSKYMPWNSAQPYKPQLGGIPGHT